jgi:hypothetical protein
MITKKNKTTLGWVVNGGRRHAEPQGDDDPPQLDNEYDHIMT